MLSIQEKARAVIAEVLQRERGRPTAEIKVALDAAYPFSLRAGKNFTLWNKEVTRALAAEEDYCRHQARRAIKTALQSCQGNMSMARIKEAFKAAYPFAERKGHAYKVWLAETKAVEAEIAVSLSESIR